jgi:hypothetical protein
MEKPMSEFTDSKTAELNLEHSAPTQSQAPEAAQPEASLNPRELAPEVHAAAQSAPPAEELSFADQKRAELAEERGDEIPEDVTEQLTPEQPYNLNENATPLQHQVRDIVSEIGVEKTEALGTAIMQSLESTYAEQAAQIEQAAYVNQLQSALNSPELVQATQALQFAQSIDPSTVTAEQWAQVQQQAQYAQQVIGHAQQQAQQLQAIEQQHHAAQWQQSEQRLAEKFGHSWNPQNLTSALQHAARTTGASVEQLGQISDPLTVQLMLENYKLSNTKEWNHNSDIARINANPDGDWASQPHLKAAYEKEQKRQAQRSAKAKAQSRNSSGQFASSDASKAQDSWNNGTGSFQDFKRSQLAAERFK